MCLGGTFLLAWTFGLYVSLCACAQALASIFMALGAGAAAPSPPPLAAEPSAAEPPALEVAEPLEEEPSEVRFAALFTGCTVAGLALAAAVQATAPFVGASSTRAYLAMAALLQAATLPVLLALAAQRPG